MANQSDRRDFDLAASQDAQANFNRVAAQLEALLSQRDQDVKAAMADYAADDVSESYHDKERRWNTAGAEVRSIIDRLRSSLEANDQTAHETMNKARAAVEAIG